MVYDTRVTTSGLFYPITDEIHIFNTNPKEKPTVW